MPDLEKFLMKHFSYETFRPGQKDTITAILQGQNVLTVLPTGAGKSLCYQFPSYYKNSGHTVIVSPLISLMEDQVSLLRKNDEKSVIAINSLLSERAKRYVLKRLNMYRFIFISPESLARPEVLSYFKKLVIDLFVIDEAHCISQWGHDFRPSYLDLKLIKKEIGNPLTLALTATATDDVKKDIVSQLFGTNDYREINQSVNRQNIYYNVVEVEDKLMYLLDFLQHENVPGIIYFSSKKEANKVAEVLNNHLPYSVQSYHGDLDSDDRVRIQEQFIHEDIRVLCATSAFGMGINKPNIRFVIHYHLPDSIENFVQESGRAGRDGEQSLSTVLFQRGDEQIHFFLQDQSYEEKQALLFLENKSEQEIKLLEQSMTDVQKKWHEHIQRGEMDWETFRISSEARKRQNQLKIYDMLDFCQGTACRRKLINKYFGETESPKQSVCCDNCGHEQPMIDFQEEIEKSELIFFNPHKKLEKMFFFEDLERQN